ncbi:MAG: oxidoreductase [Chloroflexus sp.]|uniref:(2Fe-2S)-binding protein n=1 Tax=Chloroflexus sp. TaxID=1904827 RepID=UPI0021DF2718|nr:(2Fe-2S)-binding protein [Chloroflexus sp.]GIV87899.1 MAG: oxidoreductase [Chloroflexus sp.]
MELIINGQRYTVADEPTRPLLYVLRDELGLTGTKFGCGAGICGACTVHINGKATRSCQTMVNTLAGSTITTIEGLGNGERLHPVQQAFLELQVPQCGWCMSGQMMTAAALLAETPNPTYDEMIAAMRYNYCRCGSYARISRAVMRAAELIREEAA